MFHTEAAKLFGATDAEIAEASAMGGFTMAVSTWLNAQQTDYEQFRKETRECLEYVRKHQANPANAAKGKPAGKPAHA